MITLVIVPVFIPYYADYSPINSFSNTDAKGHSKVLNHLQQNFNVYQEHLDLTKYDNPTDSLIAIISPQRYFIGDEIDFLDKWMRRGGHVIITGTSKYVMDLIIDLELDVEVSEGKIVDFVAENENPNYVPVAFENELGNAFTAVAPYSIDYRVPSNAIELRTSSAAEKASCVEIRGENCYQQFTIGYTDLNRNYGIFFDNWILRNFVVNAYPQNEFFIESVTQQFGGNINNIIIDESHYNWAPLNKKGVEVLFKNLKQSQYYPPIIFLFSVVLPLFLVLINGNLTTSKNKSGGKITSKLSERIDRLYLDKIVAVPLSMEEQLLIEENLELNARNKYYFQYVAIYYLDLINEKGINESIPTDLINALQFMKREIFDNQVCWEIIKITNYYIDEHMEKGEFKHIRSDV